MRFPRFRKRIPNIDDEVARAVTREVMRRHHALLAKLAEYERNEPKPAEPVDDE